MSCPQHILVERKDEGKEKLPAGLGEERDGTEQAAAAADRDKRNRAPRNSKDEARMRE